MTSNNLSSIDSHDYVHEFQNHNSRKRCDLNEDLEADRRIRLPIPDIRFEQTYLSRVLTCFHMEPIARRGGDCPLSSGDSLTAATHVSPVITSSQHITRIDWGKLAWITIRDQCIMPLFQGIVWGIIGIYYRPVVGVVKTSLRSKPALPNQGEGEGVGWLRSWAKKLGLSELTNGPIITKPRTVL